MTKFGGIAFVVAGLVALAGCAAPSGEAPVATVTVTASASPKAAPAAAKPAVNPNAQIEKQFTEFALMRSDVHGVSVKPSAKEVVAGLYAFCDDGKPFKVSKSSALNKNLDMVADTAYCDHLVK